jgi:hypothetical protein
MSAFPVSIAFATSCTLPCPASDPHLLDRHFPGMALETIAALSDDAIVGVPAVAT